MQLRSSPYRFLLPAIVAIAVFYGYPVAKTFLLSFYHFDLLNPAVQTYVALDNYITLFASGTIQGTGIRTILFTGSAVVGSMVFGLAIAMLLNDAFPGRKIVRTLLLLPFIFPEVVGASMWRISLNSGYGLIGNLLLPALGFTGSSILSNPQTAIFGAAMVRIWRITPFITLMLLAGVQAIKQDLYEAAKIDGANAVNRFVHITLPQLRPVLVIVIILDTVWTANQFDVIWVLTGGGPGISTSTGVVDVFRLIFIDNQAGLGQAEAVVFIVVLLVTSIVYYRVGMRGQ